MAEQLDSAADPPINLNSATSTVQKAVIVQKPRFLVSVAVLGQRGCRVVQVVGGVGLWVWRVLRQR